MVAFGPDERDEGNPLGCINVSRSRAAEGEAPIVPTRFPTPWPSLL